MEDAYIRLANSIIEQGVRDYRTAYRAYRKNPSRENQDTMKRIEKFFHSDWFRCLTELDGDFILNRVQQLERERDG